MVMAYPVLDERAEVKAVLFLGLDLAWLEGLLLHADIPEKSTLTVMNINGTILARYPKSHQWTGKSVSHTWIGKTVLTQKEGLSQGIGLDGEQSLFAFSTAPHSKAAVLTSIPQEVAFAEVTRIFYRNVSGIGVVGLIALLAAWIAGNWAILRPVDTLIATTEQLSAGDLSARTKLRSGRGELGRLAAAFDRMANSLERRYTELETLRDIDLSILSTLDLHSSLEILLDKIEQYLPYSAATVTIYNTSTGLLDPVASRNVDIYKPEPNTTTRFKTLQHLVFEHKGPLAISDLSFTEADDRDFLMHQGFNSYLGIPLAAKGEVIGVLSFYSKEEHLFSPREIDFLTMLAGQTSIAINNSTLYDRVRQQAKELAISNKVKDEFLSVMSHELRTPLNVIRGYADIVKDGTLGNVSTAQVEALTKLTARTTGLVGTINDILVATAIESRSVRPEPAQTDLGQLLNDLKSNYTALSDNKDVALWWNYPGDLPTINTDGAKLKQVLNNLIGNAIKFTQKGSVTISACSSREKKTVEFEVADTGIGIPQDLHTKIFEKFRQGDSSDSREYEGVGLGLYIAKRFTSLLGGQLSVESEPGKGSKFTVTIPSET
jgi:signal transduction histidine kinase/HAMP domain-containing protein